jgi:hypothetical protein
MPRYLAVVSLVVALVLTAGVVAVVMTHHAGAKAFTATAIGPPPPLPPHAAANVLIATAIGPPPPLPPHAVVS